MPVVQDRFTPRLVGMVTDRDLCLQVVAGGSDPAHSWISECMIENPIYCTAEDDVRHALELMEEHRVHRLPVVNAKHEVTGILSLSDLVGKGSVSSCEIATALRTISEPVREMTQPAEIVTAA